MKRNKDQPKPVLRSAALVREYNAWRRGERETESMLAPKVIGQALDDVCARAECYVPLYDALCEIVTAIKDDPAASVRLKALGRGGRKILNESRAILPTP